MKSTHKKTRHAKKSNEIFHIRIIFYPLNDFKNFINLSYIFFSCIVSTQFISKHCISRTQPSKAVNNFFPHRISKGKCVFSNQNTLFISPVAYISENSTLRFLNLRPATCGDSRGAVRVRALFHFPFWIERCFNPLSIIFIHFEAPNACPSQRFHPRPPRRRISRK